MLSEIGYFKYPTCGKCMARVQIITDAMYGTIFTQKPHQYPIEIRGDQFYVNEFELVANKYAFVCERYVGCDKHVIIVSIEEMGKIAPKLQFDIRYIPINMRCEIIEIARGEHVNVDDMFLYK
jgi:hypothetical protein